MRRWTSRIGVLLLLVGRSAGASTTVMDTWTRVSLQFTNLARAEATDTAVGVTTLTTSGSGEHLLTVTLRNGSVPGLSLDTVLPVTDPMVSAAGIASVRFTHVRAGNVAGPNQNLGVLAPISGAVGSTTTPQAGLGTVPSTGMIRICFLTAGNCGQNLPLDVGKTIDGVAQGAGAGGILTFFTPNAIRVSIVGAPYTVKTVSAFQRTGMGGVGTFTEKGFAHGPLSNTSSTGQTSGVLQLVSATQITSVGLPGTDGWGEFSRVVVHFVPEPGLLALLGSGAAAMAWIGRKRIRR